MGGGTGRDGHGSQDGDRLDGRGHGGRPRGPACQSSSNSIIIDWYDTHLRTRRKPIPGQASLELVWCSAMYDNGFGLHGARLAPYIPYAQWPCCSAAAGNTSLVAKPLTLVGSQGDCIQMGLGLRPMSRHRQSLFQAAANRLLAMPTLGTGPAAAATVFRVKYGSSLTRVPLSKEPGPASRR